MVLPIIIALVVVLSTFLVAFKNNRTYALFLFLIPLLAVIDDIYFSFTSNVFVLMCFFIAAFAIALFPFVFISDYFNKNLSLFVLVCLLIEWDWLMSWYYVFQNASAEINLLLNTSSFLFFSLQKLAPLLLLGILYYFARNEKKLMGPFRISLIVVVISYYVLFLWHLHVISVVNVNLYYLLLLSLFDSVFSVSRLIRSYLINKKIIKN